MTTQSLQDHMLKLKKQDTARRSPSPVRRFAERPIMDAARTNTIDTMRATLAGIGELSEGFEPGTKEKHDLERALQLVAGAVGQIMVGVKAKPASAAELAQAAIDNIESLTAELAALSRDDLLTGEQAGVMCYWLDDVVTGLIHCSADDTADFNPCASCAGGLVCE